jgi:hypothetical protein
LCGEPVNFVKGPKQKAHFRHKIGSLITPDCDFYAGNSFKFSEYELKRKISGLPFFLKQIGDSFQLYLGFWPVDESTLAEEKRIGQKITINNRKNPLIGSIDLADVRANETYRLPISEVYNSYEFHYQKLETALTELWGKKTSKIFSNGAFFRIGDIYSRSISLNGIINPDTGYYFLSQDPVTNKSFLEVEESHSLFTEKTQKWKIYKIRFTKITGESTRYARDHHVQLLEMPPEFIPLWPPSIQNNRKYIHQKMGLGTYSLRLSHKYGKWKVAILNESQIESDNREVSLQDPVFSIKVDNNMQYLSFFDTDDNDVKVALVTSDDKPVISYQQPALELKWMGKKILPGSELKAIKNADISINSDMKCDIILMRNNIPYQIFRDELSVHSFPDVSNGDTIIIRHGLDIFKPIFFKKLKKSSDAKHSKNLSDEALHQKLLHIRGTVMTIPTQLKYIAAGFGNYPKTMEFLKKSLKNGQISKQGADILLNKYGQGEL